MKIINETELMKNQKASTTLLPDKQFDALQTIEGHSLLFTLDDKERILYCTREVPGDVHGWVKVDLSSSLSQSCYNNAAVAVKTFDIAQDLSNTNSIDIAMVVTVNGVDYLHIATGFTNTLDNWTSNAPQFNQYKFDYPGDNIAAYQAMPVNEVQILDSNDGNGTQYIIVDLITNTATQTISRFYIDVTKQHSYAWLQNNLQVDLEAGQITSFLGCGPNDGPNNDCNVGGVYVLGTLNSAAQLMYAPTCNYLHPEEHANATIFNLPAGYSSQYMAMALSAPASTAPYTDMFFVSNYKDGKGNTQGGLYFLLNANQKDTEGGNPTPQLIYTSSLLQNIQSLHVENWNDNIVVWGQSLSTDGSGTSQLFIMEGLAGQETNTNAWSCPIPLLFNVANSATYINNNYSLDTSVDSNNGNAYGSCNVLFAHQEDGSLVQLFQDPITSAWQQRFLLSEPLDAITALYETTSYTTHIRITDDNNVPQSLVPVSVWASSPCSAYVNNTYSNLQFTAPLQTTADETGTVNIIQPVNDIGGISYYIAVQDPNTKQWYTQVVNPLAVTAGNLTTKVPDGNKNYLDATVMDEMGKTTPLVSNSNISEDQKLSTSQSVYSFGQHYSSQNPDGLTKDQEDAGGWPKPGVSTIQAVATAPAAKKGRRIHQKRYAKPDRLAKHLRFNAETDKIWGCTFGKNAKHYEGIEAVKEMGLVLHADGSMSLTMANGQLGSFLGAIESKAGHLYKWMKSEANKLEQLVIQIGTDGLDCLMTIAGNIYHFVVKCMNDIANAIHTALNAIATAFEDVIKWIGSIFGWNDIIRTHNVLYSFFKNYVTYCITNIDGVKAQLNYAASETVKAIDTWAGLPADTFPTDSYSSQSASNPPSKGQSQPSSNWGHHHLKNNASGSDYSDDTQIGSLLDDFFNSVTKEFSIISNAADQIKEILSDVGTMSLGDLLKKLVAVIADLLIESAVNLTDTLLTAAEDIIGDIVTETFTKEVHIPVLSTVYKTFVGKELNLLDVACLLMAIPLNIIYKIVNDGNAPFPDNDATTALINAATFKDFILAMPNAAPSQTQATMLQDNKQVWNDTTNTFWNLIGNSCALGGSVAVSILGALKIALPTSKAVAVFYGVFYIPYVAPNAIAVVQNFYNPSENWYNYMAAGLAAAGLIKSLVDIKLVQPAAPVSSVSSFMQEAVKVIPNKNKPAHLLGDDAGIVLPVPGGDPGPPVISGNPPAATPGWKKPFAKGFSWNDASPIVEALINIAWEVPTVFSYLAAEKANTPYSEKTHRNNILNCTGNTMFNFGGLISPISTFGPPPASIIVVAVQATMNLGYGAMVFATSVD